jgi:type I restriction enzyme S subunit
MEEVEILLPPLSEQKRIATTLDKADAIRRKRQRALQLADEFLRSLFLSYFGGFTWKMAKLAEVCEQITDGEHARPHYIDGGIPFISVKDITTGYLRFDGSKYVSEEDHKRLIRRCHPEKDDILYTEVGATYGRAVLVDTNREFSLYVSVALLKPKAKLINPYFLSVLLNTPLVKRQADRCVKGAGVPDLHLIEIKNFSIPLPPMQVQERFVTTLRQVHGTLEKSKNLLEEGLTLSSSLVSQSFVFQR